MLLPIVVAVMAQSERFCFCTFSIISGSVHHFVAEELVSWLMVNRVGNTLNCQRLNVASLVHAMYSNVVLFTGLSRLLNVCHFTS